MKVRKKIKPGDMVVVNWGDNLEKYAYYSYIIKNGVYKVLNIEVKPSCDCANCNGKLVLEGVEGSLCLTWDGWSPFVKIIEPVSIFSIEDFLIE